MLRNIEVWAGRQISSKSCGGPVTKWGFLHSCPGGKTPPKKSANKNQNKCFVVMNFIIICKSNFMFSEYHTSHSRHKDRYKIYVDSSNFKKQIVRQFLSM